MDLDKEHTTEIKSSSSRYDSGLSSLEPTDKSSVDNEFVLSDADAALLFGPCDLFGDNAHIPGAMELPYLHCADDTLNASSRSHIAPEAIDHALFEHSSTNNSLGTGATNILSGRPYISRPEDLGELLLFIESQYLNGQSSQATCLLDQIHGMDINCALHTFTYNKSSGHCGKTLVDHAQFLSILTGCPTLMPNLAELSIVMNIDQPWPKDLQDAENSTHNEGVRTLEEIHEVHFGLVEFAYTTTRLCHSIDHTVTIHESRKSETKEAISCWPMSTRIIHNPSSYPQSLVPHAAGSGVHASIQTQVELFHNNRTNMHELDVNFLDLTLIPMVQHLIRMRDAKDTLALSLYFMNLPRTYSRSFPQRIDQLGPDRLGLNWSTMTPELKERFDPNNQLSQSVKMAKQRARRASNNLATDKR